MRKLFEKRIIVVRYLLCWSVTIIFAFQNLAHHTVNNLLVPPVLMVVGVLASLVKIPHPWGYLVLGLCYAVQVVLMSTLWSVPEIFPWIVCVSEICMVECISITWGLEKEANKLVLYILIIIQVASRKVWALTDALRSENNYIRKQLSKIANIRTTVVDLDSPIQKAIAILHQMKSLTEVNYKKDKSDVWSDINANVVLILESLLVENPFSPDVTKQVRFCVRRNLTRPVGWRQC